MSEQVRPNFAKNSSSPSASPIPAEIQEQRSRRPESGAIWKRTSKTTNMEYMTLRLKFTREKLTALLNAPVTEDNLVALDLVAFPNQNQAENPKRPSYRIYEELS